MTDDEFNRIKEEEKEHLRQMRALKKAVHLLERQRSVTSALEEMTNRSREALEANEQLIEEIVTDTARQEARLDVALDSVEGAGMVDPDEIAAIRARALLEDVRRETRAERQDQSEKTPPAAGTKVESSSPESPSLPEKTLGRLR